MAQLIEKKKIPTSKAGVKSAAKDIMGTGTGALLLAAGIGAALFARPYVSRVPVLGGLVDAGFQFARPSAVRDDGFGSSA